MSLEIALRTHLLSKTSITALVSQRVVFGDIRESVEALPHIAFKADDSDWMSTLDGTAVDLQYPIYEFEVRAEEPGNLETLANLIRRALVELETGASIVTTNVGTVEIEEVEILDGGSDSPPVKLVEDDNTIEVLRRSVLAQIGFKYSVAAVS